MDKFLTQTQFSPADTCWAISMRTIGPLLFRLPKMGLPFAPSSLAIIAQPQSTDISKKCQNIANYRAGICWSLYAFERRADVQSGLVAHDRDVFCHSKV